ncbi:exosome complex component MTR3 isoform X2 [Maniola hyperantus]|uniref:exosome complex component MTR3 isoform X2 n=1 Tax=Aphantopus hyperantus TaxID=2795564 RepID=UPI0015690D14|nr:exosome complex component MTR3 isoform X2 [Maniola hyperantus]
MPLDYRRFNGPEDSVSYKRFTADYLKSYDELYSELIDANEHRKDGREIEESRTMYARSNMVSQAKGSSYIEMKKTKVVCSVFDPRETMHQNEYSTLGQLFCEVKFAPFSCHHQRQPHVPDSEEKALSVALRKALEPTVCRHLFPNFQIDIFVYILENDGSCLAAAINAAGLALANAAVPMYDIITACSVAIIGDNMFVDPTAPEEHLAITSPETNTNHGLITMSMLHELKQVADFRQIGSLDVDCVLKATDVLEQECKKIVPIIQTILVRNVVKGVEQQKKLNEETKVMEAALNAKMEEWKSLLKGG